MAATRPRARAPELDGPGPVPWWQVACQILWIAAGAGLGGGAIAWLGLHGAAAAAVAAAALLGSMLTLGRYRRRRFARLRPAAWGRAGAGIRSAPRGAGR